MTNTPSPTDEDRELIARMRKPDAWQAYFHGGGSFSAIEESAPFKAADRLESLLSDRAKLEEANAKLRRCLLPVQMTLAQAECVDEPIPDDAVDLRASWPRHSVGPPSRG